MPKPVIWVIGLAVVLLVNVLQLIFPFAFDFVSTLGVFGVGAYVGSKSSQGD